MLTTGVDDLKGTDKADLFKAVNSSIISEGTLQAEDKIDGGAGNDRLDLAMGQSFTGFTTGSVKNVENINIVNSSTAEINFDASGVTEVTKYTIDATKASVTLSDLNALVELDVKGPAKDGNITANYAATSAVSTGTQTDTQKLKVTNVGTANTKTDGTDDAKVGTVNIAKVEAIEITTAGDANTLNLAAVADAKTITVAGAGTTQINAVGAATTSFDASAATGKVIATLSNAAAGALTSVKTGSGDDTITVDAADLKINATIAGGAGSDTLSLTGTSTIAATMSGVETLKVGTGALTFSGSNVTGLNAVNLEGNTGAVSLLNMGTTALEVNVVGSNTQAVSSDTAAAVTYNMKASSAQLTAGTTAAVISSAATFDGATALTVNVNELVDSKTGAISAAQAKSLTLNVASKVVNADELTSFQNTITAGEATSVTVNSTGNLGVTGTHAVINAAKATSMTLTTGSTAAEADFLDIDATKLNSLTVNAKQDLTITEVATTSLDSIQTLNVTTDKAFKLVDSAAGTTILEDIATATVGGTASTASASLGDLGKDGLTHNINLTATGLKSSLTIGTVNAGTGSATLNVSDVTGVITTGEIKKADGGVTLTATNIKDTLTVGTGITSKGNISVDVTNAAKNVTLGKLDAGTTGDVTVLANNIGGVLNVGAITGNNVTVNTKTAGKEVTEAGVTAKTSVTWTAADVFNDNVTIATTADSTAFTATLAGGAMNEVFDITGKAAQTSITATGNLGAGTNRVDVKLGNSTATGQTVNLSGLTSSAVVNDSTGVTLGAGNYETNVVLNAETDGNISVTTSAKDDLITLAGTHTGTISITDSTTTDKDMLSFTAALTTTKLTLSGIEGINLANAAVVSMNASAVSGQTIAVTRATQADNLTLTGTAGNDTITLSSITVDGAAAANNIVNGDTGNDIITGFKTGSATYDGGAGNDVITVSQGTNTIITGTGNDTVELTGGTNTVTATNTAGETTFIKATAAGTTVNMTGAANATLDASTSTAALAINGTDGQVDTIKGGSGVDTIDAGTSGDIINISAGGNDVINIAVLDTAVAANFAASAAAATVAASQTTVGMDIITGFAAGDKVQLSFGAVITTSTTLLTEASNQGAATVGDVTLMQGTYDSTANTFVGNGTGTDSMLVYDTNGTAAAGTYEGIVLVGYVDTTGNDTISAAGLFTAV